MSESPNLTILIAEDNTMTRDVMSSVLEGQGYRVIGAADGGKAIEICESQRCDMAIVDINMSPMGGFEFVKHLKANEIDMPVIIITADESSDMLIEASNLGVIRVLQKPVLPDKLVETVRKTLKKLGLETGALAAEGHDIYFNPAELMDKAIEIARVNAESGRGGPFGAVVADQDGKVIAEGRNGRASRADPLAHAEVMAIRQASEHLNRTALIDCTLYVSSEPTEVGKALIKSVGIQKVYYALNHNQLRELRGAQKISAKDQSAAVYEILGSDNAIAALKDLK